MLAFFRPDLSTEKLILFDPWDSEVSLRQQEKIQLALDFLGAGNWQQVNIICRQIMKTHPFDAAILAEISINKIMSNKQFDYTMFAETTIDELMHDNQVAESFSNIKEIALQEIGEFDAAKHMTYYARLLQR